MIEPGQTTTSFHNLAKIMGRGFSMVVDKATGMIYIDDFFANGFTLKVQYSGGTFTNITSTKRAGVVRVLFLKTFQADKHLIAYQTADNLSNCSFFCGVAVTDFPLGSVKFANETYFDDDAVKPNTVDGIKYYSLNEVPAFTDITQVVKLPDGTYTNTGNCIGDKLFVFSGSVKECLTFCPVGRQYREPVDSSFLCRNECYFGNSAMYNDIYTCMAGLCPALTKKYYGPAENRLCTDACDGDKRYLDRDSCFEKCSDFMKPTVNLFSNTTEQGECLSTCDTTTKYLIEENTLVYPESTVKKYCLDSCSDLPYTQFRTVSSVKRCVNECSSGEYLDLQSMTGSFTPTEVNANDTNKECISTCSGYKLETTFQFASSAAKTYCLSLCPTGQYSIDLGTNNKICIENCNLSATHKYFTPLKTCLTVCDWSSTPFLDENQGEKHCLYSCPQERKYFKTELGVKKCVNSCLNGEFLRFTGTNFSESDLPSLDSGSECVSSCSEINYSTSFTFDSNGNSKEYCLDECPVGLFLLEDQLGNKSCVIKCEPLFEFSTPDFKCVSDCVNAGYGFETEDLTCTHECSLLVNDGFKCVKECPEEKKFIDFNHCLTACPPQRSNLIDFKECTDECPGRFHDVYCVNQCGEASLVKYFSDNLIPLEDRKFTLSTNQCSGECSETGISLINEENLNCVQKCPTEGPKYKGGDNYCRSSCSNEEYPLKDDISKECLAECSSERHFLFPKEKSCLEKCPPVAELVFERSVCSQDSCEEECEVKITECVSQCPPEAPFKMQRDTFIQCLCSCPEGFESDGQNTCQFLCSSVLGFLRDEEGNCIHCFRDKGGLYLQGTECLAECLPAHVPTLQGVCAPCKDIGLWVNEKSECIRFDQCDRFSQFDFPNKTCYKCNGNNLKLIVEEAKPTFCTVSDCSNGHLELEGEIEFCFICSASKFYHQRGCTEDCPMELSFDFANNKCAISCESGCSKACCVNGKCSNGKCNCNSNFYGTRCDIPNKLSEEISDQSIKFLSNRLNTRLLVTNEIEIVIDLKLAFETRRRLSPSLFTYREFILNSLKTLEQWYIPHFFQLDLFLFLDELLGLASKIQSELKITSLIPQIVGKIDTYSDEILLSDSNSPQFDLPESGTVEGDYFYLRFASNILSQTEITLKSCFEATSTTPFKLLRFKQNVSPLVERRDKLAILLSESPLTEVSVFSKGKKVDLNQSCSPRDVESQFEPELNQSQQILLDRFKDSEVNVFDKNDPFFVDRCVPFTEEGQDLTLTERKQFQIDKKELCNENEFTVCSVKQNKDGKLTCDCKGIGSQKKSALEEVINTYPDTNYILFTCVKVFLDSNLSENGALLVVALPFFLGLLLALIYSVRMGMNLENDKKYNYLREDCTLLDPSKMNVFAYFKEANNLKKIDKPKKNKKGETTIRNRRLDFVPTIGDYNHLSAEQLILLDKRSNWRFTLDTLIELHPLGKIFFKNTLKVAPTFEIVLFVTETNLTTMASAFFIDDSLVQSKNQQGDPSFNDSVRNQLVQTIWAVLTSMLVVKFIKLLIKVDLKRKQRITKEIIKDTIYDPRRTYDAYSTKHRVKLVLFLLVCACFNAVFVYFVAIYLEIYANSKTIWINGIIMGLIIKHLFVKMAVPLTVIVCRVAVRRFERANALFKLSRKLYTVVSKKE